MKKWQIFKQGVLEELPIQLGVFPFGIIYGVIKIMGKIGIKQRKFPILLDLDGYMMTLVQILGLLRFKVL